MTWVKLDDGFWMHPKVVRAGNESAGVFARCLSYCGAYLTDGLIPEPVALMIAGGPRALEKVVDAGLLVRQPSGSLYVEDWSQHNPLREQVEAARRDRQERGRKGAQTRWGHSSGHSNGHGNSHG